jgi:predicted Rossmann fold nucleotide-binding protein DprA/Smf involved in DNA uptake
VLRTLTPVEPRLVDELAALTKLPVSRVSGALLMLEMKGLARHLPGMLYLAVQADKT